MKLMNDDMLDAVSGGTGGKVCSQEYDPFDEAVRREEFTNAWEYIGLPVEINGYDQEQLFMQWKMYRYHPDAVTFLASYK